MTYQFWLSIDHPRISVQKLKHWFRFSCWSPRNMPLDKICYRNIKYNIANIKIFWSQNVSIEIINIQYQDFNWKIVSLSKQVTSSIFANKKQHFCFYFNQIFQINQYKIYVITWQNLTLNISIDWKYINQRW